MKKITVFKIEGDPYCTQLHDVTDRLTRQFPTVEIETIDTKIQPELAAEFQYEYLPFIIMEGKKVYEAHPGESYEECFDSVKKVFQAAL